MSYVTGVVLLVAAFVSLSLVRRLLDGAHLAPRVRQVLEGEFPALAFAATAGIGAVILFEPLMTSGAEGREYALGLLSFAVVVVAVKALNRMIARPPALPPAPPAAGQGGAAAL